MKPDLLNFLQCPACGGAFAYDETPGQFRCQGCGRLTPAQHGIPLFTPPPEGLVPSAKLERGPEVGTPWRRANWRFLDAELDRLPPHAYILDVGAGRGDFAALLQGRASLAVDVYPYPEVDLVCDLTQTVPLREACFDAILLMNVLEHVPDTHALLGVLARLLKPGGVLLVAIPFMVKIHQAPLDFVRYTHFALQRLGEPHGLAVASLEGYYDPVFFLGEGLGNLRHSILPSLKGMRRYAGRALLAGISVLSQALDALLGPGRTQNPASNRSLAPTGYQVVYRKLIGQG